MLRGYKVITVTHRCAELQEISNFVIKHDNKAELRTALEGLKEATNVEELLYLATCNRVAYIFYTNDHFEKDDALQFLKNINSSISESSMNYVNFYTDTEAIEYVLSVASSIDSLVVGEREILRQLREAYAMCSEWQLTGDCLRLLMRSTVEAAKEVYAKTRIGEKPISVVSLAVKRFLDEKLPIDAPILMVGAGQTNLLFLKILLKYGYRNFTIFNRTLTHAQQLIDMIGEGKAYHLDELPNFRSQFDCLVVCTGATSAIITKKLYGSLLNGDTSTKVVIDLSIPNNVAENVVSDYPVKYLCIQDLRKLANVNLAFREKEVVKAKKIIEKYLLEFHGLFQQRQIERAIGHIPVKVKSIKEKCLNQVFKKEVSSLDPNTAELVERMLSYMEKKYISLPMKAAINLVEITDEI
ncbi:MAG: glutamyl-tRNA reductase [Saprospiraceae bacterium]|nr:glutamyl-tRNA reductase [Saprospiraceae bacterium]